MRVLVTGAFGYLGLALVRYLSPEHEVIAFGHAPRSAVARDRVPANVRCIEADLVSAARVLREHAPLDAIVHLAGGGGPQKVTADPIEAVRSNVRGTSGLVEAAREAGVRRLIYASTIAVYGTQRESSGAYVESSTVEPDDLYGVIKEAAEHVWVRLGGGTALRLANIYGAGSGVDTGVAGAVERFARAAARGTTMTVFGTGAQRIDYVHVDDVVRAFGSSLATDRLPPVINIGGGAPISIMELAECCASAGRALGQTPSIRREPAPAGKTWPDRSLAIDVAAQALAWRPSVTYEAGILELVQMMHQAEGL